MAKIIGWFRTDNFTEAFEMSGQFFSGKSAESGNCFEPMGYDVMMS